MTELLHQVRGVVADSELALARTAEGAGGGLFSPANFATLSAGVDAAARAQAELSANAAALRGAGDTPRRGLVEILCATGTPAPSCRRFV